MYNLLQIKASDPSRGAWVSASAGTGKTKILTDRIIRLLLDGAIANKILCLTFTNAAASEMRERIRNKMKLFHNSDDTTLRQQLVAVFGRDPSSSEIKRAKGLYHDYVNSDEGINIHTIHSYCVRMLQKFPLEAGVTPSFRVMNEIKQREVISDIKANILSSDSHKELVNFFARNFHHHKLEEIFETIIENRMEFSHSEENHNRSNPELAGFSEKFVSHLEANNDDLYLDIIYYPLILNLVDASPTKEKVKSFFLTLDGSKRKRIVNSKIAKPGSNLYDELIVLQDEVYRLDQLERKTRVKNFSSIIRILSNEFITQYERYKLEHALLDYDDLIIKARGLLTEKSIRDWVLYKLDGGIDHVLVDEAQDTSPDQWEIIEAILEEFYTGESSRNNNRTIFVVGDEKQSIFSFQGANVNYFNKVNQNISERLNRSEYIFENITLDISYRSAKEILNIVHALFSGLSNISGNNFLRHIPYIKPHKTEYSGRVELWPIVRKHDKEREAWKIISESNDSELYDDAQGQLGKQIAEYISNEISSGKILESTGENVSAKDFMILFRTRTSFTLKVIEELQNIGIATSGLDRVNLQEELVIKDLISMAKFILNPLDELNFVCLLKSPMIGLSDSEIYELVRNNKDSALYKKFLHPLLDFIKDLFLQDNVIGFFNRIVIHTNIIFNSIEYYGKDISSIIDEFLKLIPLYVDDHDNSLQGFVSWFNNNIIEIKKAVVNSEAVRIMTVHGSKGLQAPYVILCDTTTLPTNKNNYVVCPKDGILYSETNSFIHEEYKFLLEQQKHEEYQEYLRLLYVALTRAENNLIIAGYTHMNEIPENCWYQLVSSAIKNIGALAINDKLIYTESKQALNVDIIPDNKNDDIEYFIIKDNELSLEKSSDQIMDNVLSPLVPMNSAYYGIIFHKIMEDILKNKLFYNPSSHPLIAMLSENEQESVKKSLGLIFTNKEFIELLNFPFAAEVNIGQKDDTGNYHIFRIDLIVETDDYVAIIDFKTDSKVPTSNQDIPKKYLDQLNSYRRIVSTLYNKNIQTIILWCETGNMTFIVN